jgi:hypothetical protein
VADGVIGAVAGFVIGLVHADEFEEEVSEGGEIEELVVCEVRDGEVLVGMLGLTMVMTIPGLFSLRVNKAANRRIMIVTGIAAMVR